MCAYVYHTIVVKFGVIFAFALYTVVAVMSTCFVFESMRGDFEECLKLFGDYLEGGEHAKNKINQKLPKKVKTHNNS